MFDLKGILDPIVAIINKVVPDKTQAAAIQGQIQILGMQGALQEELTQLTSVTSAQSDIDKTEASSASMFVAGWRPALGWICGVAFGFEFLLRPLLEWGFIVSGHKLPDLPRLDDSLTQLTYAMLGMGALRTVEKVAPRFASK